jgi:hypothetical protein
LPNVVGVGEDLRGRVELELEADQALAALGCGCIHSSMTLSRTGSA